MTPKRIDAYECQYCRKLYRTERGATKHERYCFKNPRRTPKQGELARAWYFDYFDIQPPPWLPPTHGYIFSGRYWVEVPDYETDKWPGLDAHYDETPVPLNQWPRVGQDWGCGRFRAFLRYGKLRMYAEDDIDELHRWLDDGGTLVDDGDRILNTVLCPTVEVAR
jgi:hypothetical protein